METNIDFNRDEVLFNMDFYHVDNNPNWNQYRVTLQRLMMDWNIRFIFVYIHNQLAKVLKNLSMRHIGNNIVYNQ
jgi:hypothetical protein